MSSFYDQPSQKKQQSQSSRRVPRANAPGPQAYYPYDPQPMTFPQPNRSQQPPVRTPPMPKGQAIALVEKIKRGVVLVTLVGFGTLSALVLSNMHADAAGPGSSSGPAQTNPPDANDPAGSNTFQPQQGGYGFGPADPGQGPISTSHGS